VDSIQIQHLYLGFSFSYSFIMTYEKFRREVERVLQEKGRPVSWKEIRTSSSSLKQRAPYHVYVQKLQGDIGLVRFKSGARTLWALRSWFESGSGDFKNLLPTVLRLIILHLYHDTDADIEAEAAIAVDEYRQLKRVYPLQHHYRRWDMIEAEVADFFPANDKRPESIRIKDESWLQRVEDAKEQLKLVERIAESGEFLHTDAWKGKTLGLTKPRFRCFYFYDSRCQFFCDQRVCVGHDMEVEEEDAEIIGDRVYFILEAIKRTKREFIWEKPGVEWHIKSVIALADPGQRRLLSL